MSERESSAGAAAPARKLSSGRLRCFRTSDRRITQRDLDAWLARVLLDVAEAREVAKAAGSPSLSLAVDALDQATRNVLQELGSSRGLPDVSDLLARAVVNGGAYGSALRLLGRDMREF